MRLQWMLVAAWLVLVTAPARADVVNRIVASVDGDPITLYELNQYETKQQALLPNVQSLSEKDALQALITEKLLAREIAARSGALENPEHAHPSSSGVPGGSRIWARHRQSGTGAPKAILCIPAAAGCGPFRTTRQTRFDVRAVLRKRPNTNTAHPERLPCRCVSCSCRFLPQCNV